MNQNVGGRRITEYIAQRARKFRFRFGFKI